MTANKYLNSNRTGHLTAVIAVGGITLVAGAITGHWLLAKAGSFAPVFEWLASPDMDHRSRKIKGNLIERLWLIYWSPFKYGVPHRSKFSHSLLIGTPVRFVYAIAPVILFASALGYFLAPETTAAVWAQAKTDPSWVLRFAMKWDWLFLGALLADAVHLWKDRYGVWEMLAGKQVAGLRN